MSYKMKVNDEILRVFKIFSSMSTNGNVYQKNGQTNILHYNEQDMDLIYVTKIFDNIFEDVEVMDFQFDAFRALCSDIAYLKKGDFPTLTVDDAKKSLTSKHRVGKSKYFFNKLLSNRAEYDDKRDAFIKPIENYAFQFKVGEKDFTHMKKRMLDVDGITGDGGAVIWSCDTKDIHEIEFTTTEVDEETGETIVEVKECYKVEIEGKSPNKKAEGYHKFYVPVEDCDFHDSFSLKIKAKNLNKAKVSSKGTVEIGFAYFQQTDKLNKIEFKERMDGSELSVFMMKDKE